MQVEKVDVLRLMEERSQYVIPIYQRAYSWTKKNWQRIFDDFLTIGEKEDTEAQHYLGSIVYYVERPRRHASPGIYHLIDGQQRLTTIITLVLSLYNFFKATRRYDSEVIEKMIEEFLFNRISTEEDKRKLILSKRDDVVFNKLIKNLNLSEQDKKKELYQCYQFFVNEIKEENVDWLYRGLYRLSLVAIELEQNIDDPQLVFETINSTGQLLTDAEKIKNWLFMWLPKNEQKKIHEKIWEPMEEEFGDKFNEDFSLFVWRYLILKNGRGKKRRVYEDFKEHTIRVADIAGKIKLIKEIQVFSQYYLNIALGKEQDRDLHKAFQCCLDIKIPQAYPLFLGLYDDYQKEIINRSEFLLILDYIESFIIRKVLFTGRKEGFNQVFASLYSKINKNRYIISFKSEITKLSGKNKFRNNDQFLEDFTSNHIIQDVRNYILRRMEEELDRNRERLIPPRLTVEHIMPQEIENSNDWKEMIGEDWERIHNKYLNTIGNLTLTGYNSEYGNRSFQYKKEHQNGFNHSPLRLNDFLKIIDYWNVDTITKRAEILSQTAKNIWKYPHIDNQEATELSLNEKDSTLSASQKKHLDFWKRFQDYSKTRQRGTELSYEKAILNPRCSLVIPNHKIKGALVVLLRYLKGNHKNRFGAEIYIPSKKTLFHQMFQNREYFESFVKEEIQWQELKEKRASRILCVSDVENIDDKSKQEIYFEWLMKTSEQLYRAFNETKKAFLV